ncbi:MAG: hypothetical protein UU64_C0010G0025 [candidate division WWE3 bacterium GW2011_GWF2_41_45]|uniref:Uncharacterized protein n=1 Tax=candidate division WWE3 bacterium GW2011_GWC2_41_23 TaxID=1619123 RepID=A0A0G0VQ71_UNCKA|nr:MAG: hypothetical protein UU55_C0006G0024 [candidate division WWE3 bacterium GW2011_GWC2_41_23]KKS10088.1 MAG: hypothetical protein UU64_C0010G0025 [candidate division WWE3 bacterium GW2011_GWF2_41_45]KKS12183.1 MAG: hypothetical protein UU68_C0004G0003 [candidate division WWE3 bacterium GW2011_GWF1_41_53]KKS30381.1 MAG: hypothetical protein UU90_C0001G0007 [candidate division WWE3 bacterium GW2011_GWD2_42_11]KKS51415.1 MAG: hypothetical protein UV16_C0001G0134 [candidate division WWE3 bacte
MNESKWARYEAEAHRAAAMVFWADFFKILGILLTSWQTYVFAFVVWGLIKIF